MTNEEIKNNSNKIYSSLYKEKNSRNEHVSWQDEQSQYFRFYDISKHLIFDDDVSLLEVGCGNGEFYKFLNFCGFKGSYKGYDINEDLLSEARKFYKNIDVANVDILKDEIKETYDFVTLSGVFNLNYGQDEKWVFEMVKKSFSLARKKFVFNAISTHVSFTQDEMFYIDPAKMLDFILKEISSHVVLEHGHIPYNYTVCIEKSKNWVSINK